MSVVMGGLLVDLSLETILAVVNILFSLLSKLFTFFVCTVQVHKFIDYTL